MSLLTKAYGHLQNTHTTSDMTNLRSISDKVTEQRQDKQFSRHSAAGKQFIKRVIHPIVDDYNTSIPKTGKIPADVSVISCLDTEVIIGIALSVTLDNLSQGPKTRTELAFRIGQHLNQEVNMGLYTERNKKHIDWIMSHYPSSHRRRRTIEDAREGGEFGNPDDFKDWSRKVTVSSGMRTILAMERQEIIQQTTLVSKGKKKAVIEWAPHVVKWSEEVYAHMQFLRPCWVPLLDKPQGYGEDNKERSYGPEFPYVSLMKQSHKSRKDTYIPQLVRDTADKLGRQGWRLNEKVLTVVEYCWREGLEVGDLISANPQEIPEFPQAGETNELIKAQWKRDAHRTYIANANSFSKRVMLSRSLGILEEYRERVFYFLYTIDTRGRYYPKTTSALNPQGSDFSKGLLLLEESLPIGNDGYYWLMIHTANQYGKDKLSFDDRIKWVEDNYDTLIAIADDPLSTIDMWEKADEPWQFLAACIELKGVHDEGLDYRCSLPIHFDGSCSGIQHYSALLRDASGCESVNLFPADYSDNPKDVYTNTLNRFKEKVENNTTPEGERLKELLPIFNRKLSKHPTMNFVYGVTRYTITNKFCDWIRDLPKEDQPTWMKDEQFFPTMQVGSGLLFEAIKETLVKTSEAMTWLQECAGIIGTLNTDISWTSPTGLEISQMLVKTKSESIRTRMFGTIVKFNLRFATDVPDKTKHKNAIAPNFVHSLDAAHLTNSVDTFNGPIGVVHDSFGTIPALCQDLRTSLLTSFMDQYRRVSLNEFRLKWESKYGVDLPEPPHQGDMDITQIIECIYAFS